MTPREAADALVREAQADGEYEECARIEGMCPGKPCAVTRPHVHGRAGGVPYIRRIDQSAVEPLSRVPGLIDEIRRERDDLRERLTAIETMHRAWAQLDRNALWFALRHYLETGDTR